MSKNRYSLLDISTEHHVYQIIDIIPASIYWKDKKGVYLGCNRYMLNMANLSRRDELVGKTDDQLPWHDISDKLHEIDNHVMESKEVYEVEETPLLANKERRTFLKF